MKNTESVSETVASADAGSEVEALNLSDGQTFRATDFHVAYTDDAGTARTYVQVLDGSGGDVIDTIPLLTSGDTSIENVNRSEIEDSVVVLVEGSADAEVLVTVGGEMVTG